MALKTWHAAFPCYSFEMMLIDVSCVYAHHFILNNDITGYFKFLEVVMVRIKIWYLWLEYPLEWVICLQRCLSSCFTPLFLALIFKKKEKTWKLEPKSDKKDLNWHVLITSLHIYRFLEGPDSADLHSVVAPCPQLNSGTLTPRSTRQTTSETSSCSPNSPSNWSARLWKYTRMNSGRRNACLCSSRGAVSVFF